MLYLSKALYNNWLSSDLNTVEPSQAPGGYLHQCYQTIFPGAHGRNCPKPGTHFTAE